MNSLDRVDSAAPLLRGALLLTVADGARAWGAEPGHSAQKLASMFGTTAPRVRAAARGLVISGCLRVRRLPSPRRGARLDYGQIYSFPAPGEEYGKTRRPRLQPVALVLADAPLPCGEFCVALEREGVLPVAVTSEGEVAALLRALAFEMVVLDLSLAHPRLTGDAVLHLYHLARQGMSGDVLIANADARVFEAVRASDPAGRPALPYHPLAVRAARQAS